VAYTVRQDWKIKREDKNFHKTELKNNENKRPVAEQAQPSLELHLIN